MASQPQLQPEEELQFYKTIVENNTDPITISDSSGEIRYWNKAFASLFGDITPESYHSLFPNNEDNRDILETCLKEESWNGEVKMLDRYSNTIVVSLKAFPARDSRDQLIGHARIYRDLTRRKQARKELLESEYQYQALVNNSPDLLYRTDLNGIITFISPSVENLSGYTVEEAIGMKMAEEVYAFPGERQALIDLLAKNGKVNNFQARLRRKDGSIWWAATNAHFLKDENGAVKGIEGVTRDITEIKEADAALKESEERFRMAGKLSYDLIYEWNMKSDSLKWFGDIDTFLGFNKGVIKPTIEGWLDLVHPEDREKARSSHEKRKTSRGSYSYEYRVRKADGGWQIWTDNALPLLDETGTPAKWIGVCTDITEKKAYETQLEQAQKMESIGTLAGGIAHDFNNLIGGLFGYLNLAIMKEENPKIKGYLKKSLQASERAADLTQQLLTFSKGGAPVKRVESLVPLIRDISQFALSGSNVSCSFAIEDNLWICAYDKNQISQVIDNIVINAQDAMPRGGKIVVKADNLTLKEDRAIDLAPGRYVRISVSDTGTGIPEDNIPRIFDPFFTTKKSGSGLGLATAYSIIKKHGGLITVNSRQGVGSTFHIFIPAAEERNSADSRDADKSFRGSGRILAMDDDQLMALMLTDLVEELGYTVVMTNTGERALETFKKAQDGNKPFTAVILDLTIRGGMGGKEAISEIRKIDRDIPVFVASGYSDDDAIANPASFGFTGSIKKPFGLDDLIRVFRKHLS